MRAGSWGRGKCLRNLTESPRCRRTSIGCPLRERARHRAWSAWERCYILRAQARGTPGQPDPIRTFNADERLFDQLA